MEKELIINSSPTEVEIALIENNKLVEIHRQKTTISFSVGDIFLGQVKKNMPSMNAAFLDIGSRKDAFHLDNFEREADNPKNGKIDQVFQRNDFVLVQVLKEPISTKGPRLSCEITLPGRYMVLSPFNDHVAVSKKISSQDERKRLKVLVESIKPKGFGVIVRTAAEGKKVADLHNEIRELMENWEKIYNELRASKEPMKLLSEVDKTQSFLRDILSDTITKISVNSKDMYEGIKSYLKSIDPTRTNMVQMYKGTKPIFEHYDISRQIKSSFGKTSTFASGGYVVIEQTEAMHVIDVNSGPKNVSPDQETASLQVNIDAAEEIARQIRLRDIGGLIVVDFIDMKSNESRNELYKKMKEFMEHDRAQHTILPLSKFGLMQITRQRVRPPINIDTLETCSLCKGTGKAVPAILAVDNIVRDLDFILQNRPNTKLSLKAHPFVASYLTKGLFNIQWKWLLKYKKWFKITEDIELDIFTYIFYDHNGDEIRLD
ncbi:MAG TPA: Rne/Rng family ribonuclease [Saprospiraceae bacterium]|nr:Rne/Rng family ribonuclease [Saprospiraceae bacterium]